jgi:FSR family fosmidomycin resistance protein-like MFS transporter
MVLPAYTFIPTPDPLRFLLLTLAGFFGGMPHSILIVQMQALMPSRQALASGVSLGFMFSAGAIGSYFLGVVADQIGLATALQGIGLLPLLGIGAALLLPKHHKVVAA